MKQLINQLTLTRRHRLLSLLFALLLLPIGAGAQTLYGLWIGSIQVTSENADAIHEVNTDSIEVSGDGSVTFDASTSTLTLTNAHLHHGIISELDNLIIRFSGTNLVNTDSQESWLSTQQAAQDNAISTTVDNAILTFEKDGEGSIQLYGKTTVYYSVISGFASVNYGNGDGQCYLHTSIPSKYDTTNKKQVELEGGAQITNATISSVVSYPLWIGNGSYLQVTEDNKDDLADGEDIKGDVSFIPENNMLKMTNATINEKVFSGLGNFTIDVEGNNIIETGDTGSVVHSINAGTLTITKTGDKASLKMESDEYGEHMPVIQGFTALDYTGFNLDTYTSAEYGEYTLYEYDNDVVKIYGLYNPDDEEATNKGIISATFTTAETLFPLWVAGMRVTSDNAENILGDDFATIVYDGATNTLTLRGCQYFHPTNSFITVGSSNEILTVHLIGYNQIGYDADYLFSAVNACTVNITTDATVPGKLSYFGDNDNMTDGNVTFDFGNSGLDCVKGTIEAVDGTDQISYFGMGQFYDDDTSGDEDYPAYCYTSQYIWYFTDATRINDNPELPPMVSSREADEGFVSRMRSSGSDAIKSLTFQCVPFYDEIPINVSLMSLDGETTYATGTLTNGSVTLELNSQVTYDDVCLTFTSDQLFQFVPMAVKTILAESYGLVVGRETVTEFNRTDVLGDDGSVSYDVETNTLTLNNAVIASEMESAGIDYEGEEDLTIMLIGTNKVQGSGCEGIRYYGEGKLVFVTNESAPGKLFNTGSEPLLGYDSNVEYQNGLGLCYTAEGEMIGVFETYPLWVTGIQVTSANKENILGGGTVRFSPTTNTLSLYGANIVMERWDSTTVVRSALANLTVELHGHNIMNFNRGFISQIGETDIPLTFTTDANAKEPGQLSWETFDYEDEDDAVFSQGFTISCESPLRDFSICETEHLISVDQKITYAIKVGDIDVTSANCTDILGDLGTVKYVDEDKALVLDNANLNNVSVTSSLEEGLTIYLLGDNYINEDENLISSTVDDVPLTFITSSTKPGRLTLNKNEDEGEWISGFAAPTVPEDYATTTDGNRMTIEHPVPITPIVQETENGETPKTEEPTEEFGWETWNEDPDTYLSIVVNNVLYTLKPSDYNEGNWRDPKDPAGVNLTVVPTDMDAVLTLTPGSDSYVNAFKGITIEVPEGNGEIIVKGEIGPNAKLAVKIGDDDPVFFPNDEYPAIGQLETINIPYSCSQNTYVRIYLAMSNPSVTNISRSGGPIRERVITGHVKVTSVGAAASSVVSNSAYSPQTNTITNSVVAYGLPSSATAYDNRGVVLSTVEVESSAAASRGIRRVKETRKITELGNAIFDDLDKGNILYIDLKGTEIHDLTVNRSGGVMDGFGENTLIYLPEGNDDGGEDNVVIDETCARLSLTDEMDFRAPHDFDAVEASVNRIFVPGQNSTLFLPFGLTSAQAASFGKFHQFKEISGSNAVFYEAETGDIAANTPYIVVPEAAELQVENVSVKGLEDFSAISGNLVGTYEKITWADDQEDIYGFAAIADGNVSAGQFVRVNAGAWISPFRAYLQVASSSRRLALVIGDKTTTAIVDNAVKKAEDDWHTIDGRRLNGIPTQEGMYINNGKIVIVR